MKTYKKLYEKINSIGNLMLAYNKARKGKSKKKSLIDFEKNLDEEIRKLNDELSSFAYKPQPLRRFIIRDPKLRIIHASAFRDRVVHHALINILEPIFEKIFIHDSYASRINKGTHNALKRFDYFKRKVSCNGKLVKVGVANANFVKGYVLKADIKHYFQTVNREVLIKILRKKIKDENVIWLVKQILKNGDDFKWVNGMPLGNYTSQFFANVYLNELDYFIKHFLKAKYYIRYVDDFVIFHKTKKLLEYYSRRINNYLKCLRLELHQDKTKILPLRNGVDFVGYKVFFHYKRIRRRNLRKFNEKFEQKLESYRKREITKEMLVESLQGWFGYAKWANTHQLKKEIIRKIETYQII